MAAVFAMAPLACDNAFKSDVSEPTVRVGDAGELPAVVSLRKSSGTVDFFTPCSPEPVQFQLRFSHPMNRGNVEQSITLDEVTGDVDGNVVPVIPGAILPDPLSFTWEDGGRQVNFTADIILGRQYVLALPASVTNEEGRGLDGLVGADVNRNGTIDIIEGPDEYARADDDFWARPIEYRSLPFFKCVGANAPSIWYAPLNRSRPRVLDFRGLVPDSTVPPAYTPANGSYAFAVTDGATFVEQPLPSVGVLRLQIASPNTAPTRVFAQRRGPAPAFPSTIIAGMTIEDESLRAYNSTAYLDDRLQIQAPIKGTASSADANTLYSDVFLDYPINSLTGLKLITRGRGDFVYQFDVIGNSAAGVTVNTEYATYFDVRFAGLSSDWSLIFPSATFRENEIEGLTIRRFLQSGGGLVAVTNSDMVVDGNTAKQVRRRTGQVSCGPTSGDCIYVVYSDLRVMEVAGKDFELVGDYLYIRMGEKRLDGERYFLRLNSGAQPITDIYGRPFIDGKADGDDTSNGTADDEWVGTFTAGDYDMLPIPPRLQLNDGRWYSPFPQGSTVGARLDLGPLGVYTHLGHGAMGRFRTECDGGAVSKLVELGFLFATPDGAELAIGDEDTLQLGSVTSENIAAYRIADLKLESIATTVDGLTTSIDFYKLDGGFLKRQPTTFVRLNPLPLDRTVKLAGADGKCGTGDDTTALATRKWEYGDRILLSHRISYPAGEDNTLDGNYDGVLSEDDDDDLVLEYVPKSGGSQFRVLQVGDRY